MLGTSIVDLIIIFSRCISRPSAMLHGDWQVSGREINGSLNRSIRCARFSRRCGARDRRRSDKAPAGFAHTVAGCSFRWEAWKRDVPPVAVRRQWFGQKKTQKLCYWCSRVTEERASLYRFACRNRRLAVCSVLSRLRRTLISWNSGKCQCNSTHLGASANI